MPQGPFSPSHMGPDPIVFYAPDHVAQEGLQRESELGRQETLLDGWGGTGESVTQVTMSGGRPMWASKEGVDGLSCRVTTVQFLLALMANRFPNPPAHPSRTTGS